MKEIARIFRFCRSAEMDFQRLAGPSNVRIDLKYEFCACECLCSVYPLESGEVTRSVNIGTGIQHISRHAKSLLTATQKLWIRTNNENYIYLEKQQQFFLSLCCWGGVCLCPSEAPQPYRISQLIFLFVFTM